jgi:hypothetical protein
MLLVEDIITVSFSSSFVWSSILNFSSMMMIDALLRVVAAFCSSCCCSTTLSVVVSCCWMLPSCCRGLLTNVDRLVLLEVDLTTSPSIVGGAVLVSVSFDEVDKSSLSTFETPGFVSWNSVVSSFATGNDADDNMVVVVVVVSTSFVSFSFTTIVPPESS